jgi:PAS domain S-box-containing protein
MAKPCDPQVILDTVNTALGIIAPPPAAPPPEQFDREHLRLLTDKLTQKVTELEGVSLRLAALIELGQELASEHDPAPVLENVCRTAREIIGAKYSAVGVLSEDQAALRHFFTSGMEAEAAARIASLPPLQGVLGSIVARREVCRLHTFDCGTKAIGLPMHSFLGAPIMTQAQVYGWLCLTDKLVAEEFSEEDERLIVTLAAQAAIAYENACRYEEIQGYAAELEQRVNERTAELNRSNADLEQRYSKAFSASPIPMSIVSHADGRYIDVNESFLENSGFAREEIIGRTTEEIGIYAYPEERERLRAVLEEQGTIHNAEVHRRVKSGEVRVALTSSEMMEINGVQCVLTANNDITERKRAEEAQRASQEQLASIIGSAMDAIITVDAGQRVVLFNAAAEKIFDCSRGEAMGQPLDRFIPERFRGAHRKHIRNFDQTNVTTRSMGSFRGISGLRAGDVEFPIEASISQVEVDGHKLYTVIIRDITERKRAEDEIAKQTAELEQHSRLLDLAQVLVRDANDNKIILWNRGAQEFYGWTKLEALGKSSHELFQTIFPKPVEEIDAEILNEGHWEGELTHTLRDGRQVTVASHQVLHRNERGEPVAILEANHDITDRKEAERRLAEHTLKLSTSEEALRAKNEELQTMSGQLWHAAKLATVGELAASIAHELNNPLATVSLRVDSLLSQTEEDDPKHRALTIVGLEVERMGNLVANLLQFSRRKDSQVSTIDIRTEVAGTLELLHSHLRNRNVEVAMEFAPNAQRVHADRQQLRQVFLNVLTNAADAMPNGGTLTIRGVPCELDRNTSALRIEFADTGIGIAEEDLPKVTEPFFTTKPEGKGTGLGLAICKRIVQEHKGEFDITSEAGKGTTVRVTLPVSASREDSELIVANGSALSAGL